jgi:hypothetical protein
MRRTFEWFHASMPLKFVIYSLVFKFSGHAKIISMIDLDVSNFFPQAVSDCGIEVAVARYFFFSSFLFCDSTRACNSSQK